MPAAAGREGRALRIRGPLAGDWNGYVRSLKVRSGRRYRVSFWLRGEGLVRERAGDSGFAGLLELSGSVAPTAGIYPAQLGSLQLNRQESAGVGSRSGWVQESFTFAAREDTQSLLLFIGASRNGTFPSGEVWFDDLRIEEEQIVDLPGFVAARYETPRSGLVNKHTQLFKVADWGSPLELSRHLEGIVIPGEGSLNFTLPEGRWQKLSFAYGPLKEFSGLQQGAILFKVLADGRQLFSEEIDFTRGEGRNGWRRAVLDLPDGLRSLTLETSCTGCSEPVAGIWGAPTLWSPQAEPLRQTLVICVDSLRRDAVGAYGGPSGVTPNIDSLAAGGTRFDNYFSAGNSTSYALTALFAGRYAGQVGLHRRTVYDALSEDYRRFFQREIDTFPALLRDQGVATFAAMDNPFFLPYATGVHVGFEEIANYGGVSQNYSTSTGHLLEFIENYAQRDYLAFLHYDPDHLLGYSAATDKPDGGDLQQRYLREINRIDAEIGRVLQTLVDKGWDQNLTVALFSDHGENLNPQRTGHGNFLSDDQIRVPLIIRQPGDAHSRVADQQLSTVDLGPWIMQQYGQSKPQLWEGHASAVSGGLQKDRLLLSEGVYQHRLGLIGPGFRYQLTSVGDEFFLTPPGAPPLADAVRQRLLNRAERFMVATRAGLYLRLPADLEVQIDLQGLKVWPIGLGENGRAWQDGDGLHLLVPPAQTRYLLFFPLEEMQFPAALRVTGTQEDVALGVADSFLPTTEGWLRWESAEDLALLQFQGHPVFDAKAGETPLLWLSSGAGVGGMATDASQLDTNIKDLLRRWGYLK